MSAMSRDQAQAAGGGGCRKEVEQQGGNKGWRGHAGRQQDSAHSAFVGEAAGGTAGEEGDRQPGQLR